MHDPVSQDYLTGEAPPPVDLRPHVVAYLANNLRTNGYEHHARTMEALAELRAVAEPSAEEVAALYRASMTETKGGFTEAIHHFARVLLSRYGAHKPDGGDVERIRNAGAILDCLTSKLGSDHPLRVEAAEGAKRAVADLYRIADGLDTAISAQQRQEGK